jgi:hypothetical protein
MARKRIEEALEFHLEGERLLKHHRSKTVKGTFADYGAHAVYASVDVTPA